MKKNITKDQVIETSALLMKDSNDLNSVNLREIARTLDCAHTNLYNYFTSYNDLLWETHTKVLSIMLNIMTEKLNTASTDDEKLIVFFSSFVDIYLDNKGWFRLIWQKFIEGERPQSNIDATEEANRVIVNYISAIWINLYGKHIEVEKIGRVMHNTHCYIVGEVSNYLLGRGLIKDEQELRSYIANEAIRMFSSCLGESEDKWHLN